MSTRIEVVAKQFERGLRCAGCRDTAGIIALIKEQRISQIGFYAGLFGFKASELTISIDWDWHNQLAREGAFRTERMAGFEESGETTDLEVYLDDLIKKSEEKQLQLSYWISFTGAFRVIHSEEYYDLKRRLCFEDEVYNWLNGVGQENVYPCNVLKELSFRNRNTGDFEEGEIDYIKAKEKWRSYEFVVGELTRSTDGAMGDYTVNKTRFPMVISLTFQGEKKAARLLGITSLNESSNAELKQGVISALIRKEEKQLDGRRDSATTNGSAITDQEIKRIFDEFEERMASEQRRLTKTTNKPTNKPANPPKPVTKPAPVVTLSSQSNSGGKSNTHSSGHKPATAGTRPEPSIGEKIKSILVGVPLMDVLLLLNPILSIIKALELIPIVSLAWLYGEGGVILQVCSFLCLFFWAAGAIIIFADIFLAFMEKEGLLDLIAFISLINTGLVWCFLDSIWVGWPLCCWLITSSLIAFRRDMLYGKRLFHVVVSVVCLLGAILLGYHGFFSGNVEQEESLQFSNLSVGDTVSFGRYEQDGNLENGPEDIVWRVLEITDDNRALLLSEYCLDCMPYNEKGTDNSWSNSTVRAWLNGEFLSESFSETERAGIAKMMLESGGCVLDESISRDEQTEDEVFILDYETYKQNVDGDAKLSAYAKGKYLSAIDSASGYTLETSIDSYHSDEASYGENYCWCWLRNIGPIDGTVQYVWWFDDAGVAAVGNGFGKADLWNAVRPAVYIDIIDQDSNSSDDSKSIHYYNYDLPQRSDGTYYLSFGPSYWDDVRSMELEDQLLDTAKEFFTRLDSDPVMATACLAYIDKEMGTRYTGEFYSSISNDWLPKLNEIAESFIDDNELWHGEVQAITRLLNGASVSIEVVAGGDIKTILMDRGDKHPILVSGTTRWPEDATLHYLTFKIQVKDTEKSLSFLIETGFVPVIDNNE